MAPQKMQIDRQTDGSRASQKPGRQKTHQYLL